MAIIACGQKEGGSSDHNEWMMRKQRELGDSEQTCFLLDEIPSCYQYGPEADVTRWRGVVIKTTSNCISHV